MGNGVGVGMVTRVEDGVPGRAGARITDGSTPPSKNGNSPDPPHAAASATNPATDHGASSLRRGRAFRSQLRTLLRVDTAITIPMRPGTRLARCRGAQSAGRSAANGRLHLIRPRPRCVAELPASRPAQGNPSRSGRCIAAPIMTLTTVETESPLKTNYQLQPCPLFVDRPRAQRLRPVRVCPYCTGSQEAREPAELLRQPQHRHKI